MGVIAVAGYGKSGQALTREALAWVAQGRASAVSLYDDKEPGELPPGVTYQGAVKKIKKDAPAHIWMSPGISPKATGLLVEQLTGELDLAQAHLQAGQRIAAVTGTNGKTTTVELLTHLLNHSGRKAAAVGNIGTPWLDAMDPAVQIYVVEVSSFQLELTKTFHPHLAVITNINADHLDWHGTQPAYARAKWRITQNQTPEDAIVLGTKKPPPKDVAVQALTLRTHPPKQDAVIEEGVLKIRRPIEAEISMEGWPLKGGHNEKNLRMAALAALWLGVTPAQIQAALPGFPAPPHRQQPVGEYQGVHFINDSKGTNPHAVKSALQNYPKSILIFGGFDKGLACAPFLIKELPYLKGLVLLGPLGARLMDELPQDGRIVYGRTLEEAFNAATAIAQPGDTVLLSPGSSSFDEFQDYTKRGDAFVHLVRRYADVRDP